MVKIKKRGHGMVEFFMFLIVLVIDKYMKFNTVQIILIWSWYLIACLFYQYRLRKIINNGGKKE